jgi:hypothetical protein
MMEVYLRYWMNVINSEYSVQFPTNLPPAYNGHNWNVSNCQYADLTQSSDLMTESGQFSQFILTELEYLVAAATGRLAGWLCTGPQPACCSPAAEREREREAGSRSTNLRYWELTFTSHSTPLLSPARQTMRSILLTR